MSIYTEFKDAIDIYNRAYSNRFGGGNVLSLPPKDSTMLASWYNNIQSVNRIEYISSPYIQVGAGTYIIKEHLDRVIQAKQDIEDLKMCTGCSDICYSSCTGDCSGNCSGRCGGCSGSCSTGGCSGGSSGGCWGCWRICYGCSGGCDGGCHVCKGCTGNCYSSCTSCSGGCLSNCLSSCRNGCETGCNYSSRIGDI